MKFAFSFLLVLAIATSIHSAPTGDEAAANVEVQGQVDNSPVANNQAVEEADKAADVGKRSEAAAAPASNAAPGSAAGAAGQNAAGRSLHESHHGHGHSKHHESHKSGSSSSSSSESHEKGHRQVKYVYAVHERPIRQIQNYPSAVNPFYIAPSPYYWYPQDNVYAK